MHKIGRWPETKRPITPNSHFLEEPFLEGSFLEKAIFEAHSLLQRPEKGDLLLLSLELRVICACYQLRLSALLIVKNECY